MGHGLHNASDKGVDDGGMPCVGLIADLVGSRGFRDAARRDLQRNLDGLMGELNAKYSHAVLSKFLVTAGDEFQGLLREPDVVPDVVWDVEYRIADVDVRIGIGRGSLETEWKEFAVGMDGPVWHAARESLEEAKRSKSFGGVFNGFGENEDDILNGCARMLRRLRESLSDRQRQVLHLMRQDMSQKAIAEKLGISRQAVSRHVGASGWAAYQAGELAWRAVLAGFDSSRQRSDP